MDNNEIVKIFKALCDTKRIEIIKLLQKGELCACNLQEKLDIGQSGLSYHMKILVESNLVTSRIEGKWSHYSLNLEGKNDAKQVLESLIFNDNSKIVCDCKK